MDDDSPRPTAGSLEPSSAEQITGPVLWDDEAASPAFLHDVGGDLLAGEGSAFYEAENSPATGQLPAPIIIEPVQEIPVFTVAPEPPRRRKKKGAGHRRRTERQPQAEAQTFNQLAMTSLNSFRGGTRTNLYSEPAPNAQGIQPLPVLERTPSYRQMGLLELMNSVGYLPSGTAQSELSPELTGAGSPEMVEVSRLGRTTPAPMFPAEAVAASEAAAFKAKRKKKKAHKSRKSQIPATQIYPEDYPTYPQMTFTGVDDGYGEYASPLEPPLAEEPVEEPSFLPIPPPPLPPTMPKWLEPLFPAVHKLHPYLASRHPNLPTNVLSRLWVLLLVAIWVIIGYIPFFPPSSSSSQFTIEANNYTAIIEAGGPELYSVSSYAGYSNFRHVASLYTNSKAPGSVLPVWSNFMQNDPNGTAEQSPKQACIDFMKTKDWFLPGYTASDIPDPAVSNDTSGVDIRFNGPSAPTWGVPRANGSPALRSVMNYIAAQVDRITRSTSRGSRGATVVKALDRIFTRDSNPLWPWDQKQGQDVVDGETGDYVNPRVGLRTIVAAGVGWISVKVPATTSTTGAAKPKTIVIVAGVDTPPTDPPVATAAGAPGLLLAFLSQLISVQQTPMLPYDVILLFITGTAAPTQETSLSAPSSTFYADAGATGLLLQPAFRHYLSNSSDFSTSDVRSVVWLGPIGSGQVELEYANELSTTWAMLGGTQKVARLQGIPPLGTGSSLGRWIRTRSNATWTQPYLGPLWDQRVDRLKPPVVETGAERSVQRIRIVHAYTKGANDRVNWQDRATTGSFGAMGSFLQGAVAEPAKFEAQANYGTDYTDASYYPLGKFTISWSIAGAWAFASIDLILAMAAFAWAFYRKYATHEAASSWNELGACAWAMALWLLGTCIVGVGIPVGVWWIASFSSTTMKLYLPLGLPPMIPSPSLPLLTASLTLAWAAVSTGESTIPTLHSSSMLLLAIMNVIVTALIPPSNWFLSFTILFGVLIGLVEFWCDEYARYLVKREDVEHYEEQLENWKEFESAIMMEEEGFAEEGVPIWTNLAVPAPSTTFSSRSNGHRSSGVPRGQSATLAIASEYSYEEPLEGVDYRSVSGLGMDSRRSGSSRRGGSPDRSRHGSRRAAAQSRNVATYADIDTTAGAAVLSDMVDDMLRDDRDFDDEYFGSQDPLHGHGDLEREYSPVERANEEVYRLFYTGHLYHLPTTLFLVVRALTLPFMALAPILAAVAVTETTTDQMSSWVNDVTGVPWVAVVPSAATAITVSAIIPLWAMWSENRVTERGVEKDWSWVRWTPPAALFIAFLGTFLYGLLHATKFTDGGAYPIPTTVGYFLDTSLPFGTTGGTMFFSTDETIYTPFSAQLMGFPIAPDSFRQIPMPVTLDYGRSATGLRMKGRQTIQSNAAMWSLQAPEVTVRSDLYYGTDTTKRDMRLVVGSPRGAYNWAVQVQAPSNVLELRVDETPVDLSKPPGRFITTGGTSFNKFHIECVGCPQNAMVLGMILDGIRGNVTVGISELSWGLPYAESSTAFPPFPWDPRPAPKEQMGSWWGMADPTIIFASNLIVSRVNASAFEVGGGDETTRTTVRTSTTRVSSSTSLLVSSTKTVSSATTKTTAKTTAKTTLSSTVSRARRIVESIMVAPLEESSLERKKRWTNF